MTITIEVSSCHSRSARTARVEHSGGEAAVALIEQHPHRASGDIDHRQIGEAVTVEVGADHRAMTEAGRAGILFRCLEQRRIGLCRNNGETHQQARQNRT